MLGSQGKGGGVEGRRGTIQIAIARKMKIWIQITITITIIKDN